MKRHLSALFLLLLFAAVVAAAYEYRTGMEKQPPITFNRTEKKIVLKPKVALQETTVSQDQKDSEATEDSGESENPQDAKDTADTKNPQDVKDEQKSEAAQDMSDQQDDRTAVDLIIFAGQSNMSGYGGDATQIPELLEGAGGEFRAVSDPTCLYTIVEPFGYYENTEVMNDFHMKRGSLVTAFVNAYYEKTGVPVVAVSASKGGMSSSYWASDAVCEEVVNRYRTAYEWLNGNGYRVRFKYLVFLQGENNVIEKIPTEQYQSDIYKFSQALYQEGLDKFFLIRIGGEKQNPDAFNDLIALQTELCRNNPNFVLASTVLSAYTGKDMVDEYHYTQQVLNDVGDDAGSNVGEFSNTWIEPSMYDYKYGTTYEPMRY